jgi:hypothetical protein
MHYWRREPAETLITAIEILNRRAGIDGDESEG